MVRSVVSEVVTATIEQATLEIGRDVEPLHSSYNSLTN
jgi:hypothetical protein